MAVSLSAATERGSLPIALRLYLPEPWSGKGRPPKRLRREPGPTKYRLSTLPETMSLDHPVGTAKERWRIERDYLELK